ncbi:MAG: response regulator [bacterium]
MEKKTKNNLLIVDDEQSILIAYRQLFKNDYLNVDVADNNETAEMMLLRKKYDAVITDLELSKDKKKEGMLIIKRVKDLYPKAIKIMITAYGNNNIKEEALSFGADYYFEKPVSIKIILSILENSGIYNQSIPKKAKEENIKNYNLKKNHFNERNQENRNYAGNKKVY